MPRWRAWRAWRVDRCPKAAAHALAELVSWCTLGRFARSRTRAIKRSWTRAKRPLPRSTRRPVSSIRAPCWGLKIERGRGTTLLERKNSVRRAGPWFFGRSDGNSGH